MRRFAQAGAVAVLLCAGTARSEAAPTLQFRFAQGATTLTTAVLGSNVNSVNSVTVGDYAVSVSGAATNGTAGPGGSGIQSSTIQVRRVGSVSAAPLVVWITVVGYTSPVGPDYEFDTAHAATKSGTKSGVDVAAEAYIDFSNASFGTQFSFGPLSCSPSGAGILQSCKANMQRTLFAAPGPVPSFSMTLRLEFGIGQADTVSVLGTTTQVVAYPPKK